MNNNKNNNIDEKDNKDEKSSLSNDDVKPNLAVASEEDNYSEETLNVALYYEIASTLYNSLGNLLVRNAILSDESLLNILQLQISNLLFLEKQLPNLSDKNYAREFLQIISNLTNRSFSITKSINKNRIEILEERNLLIVSITNSCKNIERESLERLREFNNNSFNDLNDQISALNNFSPNVAENKVTPPNNNSNTVIPPVNKGPLNNNGNINSLDNNSLANLTKMGVLPQHPASNPNFYPYISKPKYIPLLKKILCGFLLLTTILMLVTYILTYVVNGDVTVLAGSSEKKHFNLGKQTPYLPINILITILLNAGFLYSILSPGKLKRETYRTSYFLLVILILWIIYSVYSIIIGITDANLKAILSTLLKKDEELNPDALVWLKGLSSFHAFKILSYIVAVSAIFPIAIALVIAILNPKIDKNKILRANSEYQNAVNSALNGQPYEMDPTLFDNNSSKEEKKDRNSHKFWRDSDIFK